MVTFKDVIRTLEARWFMSSMATGAVGIGLNLLSNNSIVKYTAITLVILAYLFFILALIIYSLRIFMYPKEVLKDLKHPIANNFFAGVYISIGVLITGLLQVLMPNGILNGSLGILTAKTLYIFGLILILTLIIAIPSINTILEKVDTKHSLGIWFLPPVGLFVFVFAGNFLAMQGIFTKLIQTINPFLIGLAFIWWFLRLNFIFYRIKFHPLPPAEMAPSFVIGLAPPAVSVIALITTAKLFNNPLLIDIAKGYGLLIYGFGIWWALITTVVLSYYLIKHEIPYTLGFWAFIFPPAAFGIAAKLMSLYTQGTTYSQIFEVVYLISIIVASLLWVFVVYKTTISIITGKAFQRPKVLQQKNN
jgi:C4-dicarboxylate transporter/malic acid transport protein